MKIGVYALCKNEAIEIDGWYASCADADIIVVTDTGSTDGSPTKFPRKVQVRQSAVLPWRFDDAFNAALSALPADVDVAIRLDFDERLSTGWRAALEAAWLPGTTHLRYPYVWNWNPDGSPDRTWWGDRIHARAGYRWSGATHEGLVCRGESRQVFTEGLRIHQFPRVKARPNDLPLLEEAVRDTPNDTRLWGYLAREYWYHGRVNDAVRAGIQCLDGQGDTQEAVLVCMVMAKCEPARAVYWLERGCTYGVGYREPLVDLAMHHYWKQDWEACLTAATAALKLTARPQSYICTSEAWGARPHDLAAVAAWHLGMKVDAITHVKNAIALDPHDLRLQTNYSMMSGTVH